MCEAKQKVVEAYRLDRYDNIVFCPLGLRRFPVGRGRSNVEAYRLDRYDNLEVLLGKGEVNRVVEAYRLDRYDNSN